MLRPNELQKLGEKLSRDYLEHNTPLNEGLDKVASANGLNRNQIDRVAEVANVKTHLELLKQASSVDEAYITFDLADPSTIKAVERIKESGYTHDYDNPPDRTREYEDQPLFKFASLEEEERPDPVRDFKASVEIRQKIAALENRALEGSIKLENHAQKLYHLLKQAALSGVDVEQLHYVTKTATPMGEFIAWDLKQDLSKDGITFPEKESEKYASRRINKDSKLYNALVEYNDDLVETLKVAEAVIKKRDELDDSPIQKIAKKENPYFGTKLASVIKFIINRPKTFGAAGIYTLGRAQQKKIDKAKSPLLQSNYITQRPTRSQV